MACGEGFVVNPRTRRCVSTDGRLFKALLREGVFHSSFVRRAKKPLKKNDQALFISFGQGFNMFLADASVITPADAENFRKGKILSPQMWLRISSHPSFRKLSNEQGVRLPRPRKAFFLNEYVIQHADHLKTHQG